jgi:hypothetical protein
MGIIDFLNEQYFILFSIYYYEVFLYKDNIQVKRIIQTVSFSNAYIVDIKGKKGWPIIQGVGFVKGHKIILHYDIDGGLPLTETNEEHNIELNDTILKIQKISKLSAKVLKEEIKKAYPLNLINVYNFPSTFIFELFNASFVTKILAEKKTTNWTMVLLLLLVIVGILGFAAIMVFGVFNTGGVPTVIK